MVLMYQGQVKEYLVETRLPLCELRHSIIGVLELPLFGFSLRRVELQEFCNVRQVVHVLRSVTCRCVKWIHCGE